MATKVIRFRESKRKKRWAFEVRQSSKAISTEEKNSIKEFLISTSDTRTTSSKDSL